MIRAEKGELMLKGNDDKLVTESLAILATIYHKVIVPKYGDKARKYLDNLVDVITAEEANALIKDV